MRYILIALFEEGGIVYNFIDIKLVNKNQLVGLKIFNRQEVNEKILSFK